MNVSTPLLKLATDSLLLAGLATLAPCALCQNADQTARTCQQYEQTSIPPADLPSAQERAALASCDSLNLYFGVDVATDPATARKCAYVERD